MKYFRKLSLSAALFATGISPLFCTTAMAAQGLEITDIVANTVIGLGGREVESFVITVNNPELIADLKAGDFDIINNPPTTAFDVNTNEVLTGPENDGIQIQIQGNQIVMQFTPFSYAGVNGGDGWQVISEEFPELSFSVEDVTDLNTQTIDDFEYGSFDYAGLTREYALYVPEEAQSAPVPLVVWNHGGGEYNGDIHDTVAANQGLTAWIENETLDPAAVMMIQVANPNYSYGTAEDPERQSLIDQNNALQASLIRQLIADGIVDAERVYITGGSSGGGATMRFVMQYPELVAGAIAFSSHDPIVTIHDNSFNAIGKDPDADEVIVEKLEEAFQGDVFTWNTSTQQMEYVPVNTNALINVPIWFIAAQGDLVLNYRSTTLMYQALENLGAKKNLLTIYSDAEMNASGLTYWAYHWSWAKALDDGEVMEWLFEQKKDAPSKPWNFPGLSGPGITAIGEQTVVQDGNTLHFVSQADGTSAISITAADGTLSANAMVSQMALDNNMNGVLLPVDALPAGMAAETAPSLEISMPAAGTVLIPVIEANVASTVLEASTLTPVSRSVLVSDEENTCLMVDLPQGLSRLLIVNNFIEVSDLSTESRYWDAVEFALSRGIMVPTDGLFLPSAPVSRAQFVTYLYRLAGSPAVQVLSFFDDVQGTPFYEAIQWALNNGITTGYNEEQFGANDPITSEQALTMIWRLLGKPAADANLAAEAQKAGAASWAADAVAWSAVNGIIVANLEDSSSLETIDGVNKEQAAMLVYRVVQNAFQLLPR